MMISQSLAKESSPHLPSTPDGNAAAAASDEVQQLKKRIAHLEFRYEKVTNESSQLRQTNHDLEFLLKEAKDEATGDLHQQISDLKNQLEEAIKSAKNHDSKHLQSISEKFGQMDRELSDLRTDKSRLLNENQQLKEDNECYQRKVNAFEAELTEVRSDNSAKQEKIHKMEHELQSLKEGKTAHFFAARDNNRVVGKQQAADVAHSPSQPSSDVDNSFVGHTDDKQRSLGSQSINVGNNSADQIRKASNAEVSSFTHERGYNGSFSPQVRRLSGEAALNVFTDHSRLTYPSAFPRPQSTGVGFIRRLSDYVDPLSRKRKAHVTFNDVIEEYSDTGSESDDNVTPPDRKSNFNNLFGSYTEDQRSFVPGSIDAGNNPKKEEEVEAEPLSETSISELPSFSHEHGSYNGSFSSQVLRRSEEDSRLVDNSPNRVSKPVVSQTTVKASSPESMPPKKKTKHNHRGQKKENGESDSRDVKANQPEKFLDDSVSNSDGDDKDFIREMDRNNISSKPRRRYTNVITTKRKFSAGEYEIHPAKIHDKVVVFASENKCYAYLRQRHFYRCSNCVTKMKNTVRGSLEYDENGEQYFWANDEHECEPQPYKPADRI